MPDLDPQMAAILERMEAATAGQPDFTTLSPAAARAQMAAGDAYWNEDPPALPRVEDVVVGGVAARLYDPGVASPAPAILYMHGGGWVICSLDSHDAYCRALALSTRAVVVSLDYRLAPEHPFPAVLEDCLAAIRWLAGEGGALELDPARLAIAGDSAGANLALATCLALRDSGEAPVHAGLLIYGIFGDDLSTPSQRAYGEGYVLTTAKMRWFFDHYVPDRGLRRDPLVSPLYADLTGLPPLYLNAAEFDPLCDDAVELASRLAAAGQPHDFKLWPGVTHGFLRMSRDLDVARLAHEEAAAFVTKALGTA